MINPSLVPISSSDVNSYDGNSLGKIPLGSDPTLNSVLEAIGVYCSAITTTTTLSTNNLTSDTAIVALSTLINADLTTIFKALDAYLLAIDLTPYLLKSTYDAGTILVANADNTPITLTVGASTVVGKKASGNIAALTGAEVNDLIQIINADANSVFPYNTALPFSVGAGTGVDKVLLTVKDTALWATNPYISWVHNMLYAAGDGLSITGKAATKNYLQCYANTEDSGFIAKTSSTAKIASTVLTDGTNTWYLEKDGTDSNKFKIRYYDGATSYTVLSIDKTTQKITFNATTAITGVIDEDTFATDSAVHIPTQQSTKAYIISYAARQTEVDAVETGAGLNTDGTYTPDAGSTYITAATSLKDADSLLDDQIKLINDKDVSATQTSEKHVKCAYGTFTYSQQPTTGVYTINLITNIPDNSIITCAIVDVTTVFTDDDANTSTIGIGIENIGAGTEDIKTAGQITSQYILGLKNEAWSTYKRATPFKLTAAKDITVNVVLAGAATTLSTGKLSIYVEYFTTE